MQFAKMSSSVDFYTTLIHELGHAHFLDHNFDLLSVVYNYSTATTLNYNDVDGGKDVINYTQGWIGGGDCPTKHDTVLCGINGMWDIRKNHLDATMFPNPFTNEISIKFMEPSYSDVQVCIYDLLGRPIYRLETRLNGQDLLAFSFVDSLPEGMYIISVEKDGMHYIQKIIKV